MGFDYKSLMDQTADDPHFLDAAHFERLFKEYYNVLYTYAYSVCAADDMAEEVVQNVFLKLWEKRADLKIHTSWKAYLYKAVYHDSLNALRHRKFRTTFIRQYEQDLTIHPAESDTELKKSLHKALAKLPEKCSIVFQLNRFQGLKYQEIADQLGISLKTVEAHMTKALKTLRVHLAEFIGCLIFFTFFYLLA